MYMLHIHRLAENFIELDNGGTRDGLFPNLLLLAAQETEMLNLALVLCGFLKKYHVRDFPTFVVYLLLHIFFDTRAATCFPFFLNSRVLLV